MTRDEQCDLAAYLWLARQAVERALAALFAEDRVRQTRQAVIDLRRAWRVEGWAPPERTSAWIAALIEVMESSRCCAQPLTDDRLRQCLAVLDGEIAALRLSGIPIPEEITA